MGHIDVPQPTETLTLRAHKGPKDSRGSEVQTEWVKAADYEALRTAYGVLRRTVALAHMHLYFHDASAALRRIERDTGLTMDDARAMKGIVEEFSPGGGPVG